MRRDEPLALEATLVEPVDVGEGGELDIGEALPGAVAVDELPLVEPAERLGQGVVVGVASRAIRRHDLVGGDAFGVADRQVLDPNNGRTGSEDDECARVVAEERPTLRW